MLNPNVDPAITPIDTPLPPALPPSSGEAVVPGPEVAPPSDQATAAPSPAPAPSAEPSPDAEPEAEKEEVGDEFEMEAGFLGDLYRAIRRSGSARPRPQARGRITPRTRTVDGAVKPNPVAKEFLDQMEFILPTSKRVKIRMPDLDSENRITNLLNVQAEYYRTLFEDAKRGVISDVELRQKSHRIISDLTISKWKRGEVVNAEQLFAHLELLAETGNAFVAFKDAMIQKKAWDLPETREQALRMLGIILDLNVKSMAYLSETGRSLRVPQVEVKGLARAKKIGNIAQALNEASALTDANVTVDQLFESLKALKSGDEMTALGGLWANTKSMFYEFWLNSLLSGPVTLTGNLAGNTVGLANSVLERYIAAGWGAILPGQSRVYFREGNAMVGEILDSLTDAWRSASKVYHEETTVSFSKLDVVNRGAWSVENLGDSMMGRFFDTVGYYIVRHPSRMLQGTDQFFKFLAFRASLRAESERLATQQGLKGLEYTREVNRIMTSPEVFETVHANAEAFSNYVTFTQNLGERGMKLMAARDAMGPLGHIAFPFLKTPANVMKHIGERLPLVNVGGSLLDKAITGNSTALYADFSAGGARRNMALSKVSNGMAAAALVWYWAANGYITGMGSKDKRQVDALVPTGWKEYSIHVPGVGYVGYNRTDPLGGFIAAVASLAQLSQGHSLSFEEVDDMAMALVTAYSDTFITRSFVMGFSRVADVMTAMRRGELEGSMMRFASQTIGSVVPNFFAQANRAFLDNRQTEVDGMLDRAASRVPYFSKGVRPVRNLWGDEVRYATYPGVVGFVVPFEFSKEVDDPEAKEIARIGLRVPEIPKTLFGPEQKGVILDPRRKEEFVAYGLKLTGEQQDRFAVLRGTMKLDGKTLRRAISAAINSTDYKSRERTDGPNGTRAAELGAIFNAYHTEAEHRLMRDYPDLEKARERVHEKRGKIKLGGEQGDNVQKIIQMFGGGR